MDEKGKAADLENPSSTKYHTDQNSQQAQSPHHVRNLKLLQCGAQNAKFHIPHRKFFKTSQDEKDSLADNVRPSKNDLDPFGTTSKRLSSDKTKLTKASQDTTSFNMPGEHDYSLMKLINEKIKNFKNDEFVYLTYAVPEDNELFTPYNLREATYKELDKRRYFTISRHGVTYWSATENNFTKLDDWIQQYHLFIQISRIKLFSYFRVWKGFKVWQKSVQWKKFFTARNFIQDNLFIAIPDLAKAALRLQKEIYYLNFENFANISVIEEWHLFYFIEVQMEIYEILREKLMNFRNVAKEYIYDACYNAIVARGYHPVDEIEIYNSIKKMKEAMNFMERAKKRNFCKLLSNFLTYCDHMVLALLHKITSNTFCDYAKAFNMHHKLGPTLEDFENKALDVEIEKPRPEDQPQIPFFCAELVLNPDGVEVDPSMTIMKDIFQQLIDLIMEAVTNPERFTNDPFYLQFTEPSITGRQEDRLSGAPPDFMFLLSIDSEYQSNRALIWEVIESAYEKAQLYVSRFEEIRINYGIDVSTNPNEIRAEKDLLILRKYCERYHNNMLALEGIRTTVNLGILRLKQETFKETVIPVCRELLGVLEICLPKLAIEEVEKLMEKTENLMGRIEAQPTTTLEYVNYLRFLDKAHEELDVLFKEIDYAHDTFIIMKDYQIFIDQEEKEKYMDCEDLIITSKEVLESKRAEKSKFISELSEVMQTDIAAIFEEVNLVSAEIKEPKYLDKQSDGMLIISELNALAARLQECHDRAQEYKGYQREFKIDITRYDELDAVIQEIRLRQNLWNSIDEWKTALEDWYAANFYTLNMEELSNINSKILKNCTQFEKYLPPNKLVPELKASAEEFRDKLPVIGYLRNPNLKPRHWARVEQIIQKKVFQEENITIPFFEENKVFEEDISLQLMEVSSQATGESQLENLLKTIENIWKETELSIVPHRDSKDIFLLAGIDELQTILDDSNVNINTIAASRHVGPIKPKVDEWIKLMEQFYLTLEEWLACQTSWIYLEAIFSSPDIQRQLPQEARMFTTVDKNFKEVMRNAYKITLALPVMTNVKNYEKMKENNRLLDNIIRCLEAYLEVKRVAFPRFYFLSNDELLEILAQTRNPHAVQPHLRKCFDAIARLEFGVKEGGEGGKMVMTNDIMAMISPEGEKLTLGKGLKARGPTEDWLSKVEDAMFLSVKRYMKFAYQCYPAKDRSEWFQEHPNQVVLTVSQQQWAAQVHKIFDNPDKKNTLNELKDFETQLFKNLAVLASITRKSISSLLRKILCALITIDVHAKDSITNLLEKRVIKSTDFGWLKMLRFYWIPETETMNARMASASLPYYYEYLGASGVLVLTPLTDRCYLCLMGALQMDLGGAPAGPAGTGKTETTKDLAKALAKQCVVFNCSEGLDFKMMGRFFSGLAQCGAWCCFDEFNRIDIEVLSVIAQQLITIRNAKALRAKRFFFEGREIKLDMSCAVFITMNPGYAGRTELPDNLKALFRPISMMVPDYALISEVILYSEGFENPKILAHKMVQMYKLCSEQLSQQNHYDFGMRAVKSVLVMAGSLKRSAPHQAEDITLIAALRDSNLPKFLVDDAILFKGILSDLFPGITLPETPYGPLQMGMEHCLKEKGLQPLTTMVGKCVQLYETMCVRWGVMLVGPTGGGKTTVLHTLACTLTLLFDQNVEGPNFRKVIMQTLNPKSVSLDELYGAVNSMTLEWQDGLMGIAVRTAVVCEEEIHQWIVCDGPVDAVWIESMNTVLDDNKMLCLTNSERIKLTPWVHMVFEVQDLAQASPATVSRCGMVYIDPDELGWLPLFKSWKSEISKQLPSPELTDHLYDLYKKYFGELLKFAVKSGAFPIHQVTTSKVSMCCELAFALIERISFPKIPDVDERKSLLMKIFVWTTLWSIGCNFTDSARDALEQKFRDLLRDEKDIDLPTGNIWELNLNLEENVWESWNKSVEKFKFNSEDKYFDMQVPTTVTTKFGYIAQLLFSRNFPVMFTGDTGVGKTVLAVTALKNLAKTNVIPVFLNFSAQTSSPRTQEMIEARLEKRRRTQLSAPMGKILIVFIDDVNMPKLDTYGSQPPIELLRQFLDFKGFFDREKMFWKDIINMVLGAACAPPGGGRNPLTPRFVRHFALLNLPNPNEETLKAIFNAILKGFFEDFSAAVRPLAEPVVDACVDLYMRIAQELLPTPDKSHYVFNLRDLSKCIQGILQSDSSNYNMEMQILRLFYHETMRVFHDRLINDEDKNFFKQLMSQVSQKHFGKQIVKENEIILFGDFMIFGQALQDRIYEEIRDFGKLKSILMDFVEDYNINSGQEMKLILFQDAIEHTVRLARLLRADRGNGLLIGVAGMGKQSLTRLAAHVNEYKCFQIELTRNYDQAAFHEDLKTLYRIAGVNNTRIVFLLVDTQIVEEEFLEDINNILNSGEVPNLFEGDDYEKVILETRDEANAARKGKDTTREDIYKFFIERVRNNLHVVISMSPIGDAFRRRCRMFPSLVNCCTIDWFSSWPSEALYSVALGILSEVAGREKDSAEKLAKTTVFIHNTVEHASEKFYREMRRHYYTTPSSYLELLKLYKSLLKTSAEIIIGKRKRIANGLNKILETNDLVAVMQKDLERLVPMLDKQSTAMKELLEKLEIDTANADIVKESVSKDEAVAKEKANVCQAIADDAAKDLEIAMPALREAEDALNNLSKSDINEIKSFTTPPQMVQFVMEAVCILLGAKPTWASAKGVMADVNFVKRLIEYDKEHIPEKTLLKVKKYIDHKDFVPAKIEKVSKVAKSVAVWIIAIDKFAKVYKVVEPKIKKQEAAEVELKQVMKVLREKQQELAEVEAKIQLLKDKLEEKKMEFKRVQDNVDVTSGRLNRASRLTSALSDEEIRWKETVKTLTHELWAIPGDVLVAAACVAYLGAFSTDYRKELSQIWVLECAKYEIPSSGEFNIIKVLGDQYEMRTWNMAGLPRDNVSIENGLYATRALRWPLMIDPQEQANRWIRNLETKNRLYITKMTDVNLSRTLEICIRQGYPILIEDIGEHIDPSLNPVLQRLIKVVEGRQLMKLGDALIEYDPHFKLYMTTKLSNPHYLPEVCINVTLVNFLVTLSGLEDQLLAEIVAIELPILEKQRNELIVKINTDKQQLLLLEDKVLKLLYSATGNILDDEELVETLNDAKETSLIIATRLIDTEETEAVITATREKYRTLASRGAVLFFVVASLAEVDPMYQYSLKYFTQIFCMVLNVPQEKTSIEERIKYLKVEELKAIYLNISRGLFEKHKIIFSFTLAIAIEKQEGQIVEEEMNYFLRGPTGEIHMKPKPDLKLSSGEWESCLFLEQNFPAFKNLSEDLQHQIVISLEELTEKFIFGKSHKESVTPWNEKLSYFQKLMLFKTFKKDRLLLSVNFYVRVTLGKFFAESTGSSSLASVYQDTSNITPLVFVLSTGSDPMSGFLKFTTDMKYLDKFYSISLGQGQGPIAESMLDKALKLGYWVFLQNCHLATSWMEQMENIVRNISLGVTKAHTNFRLFLSSMPTKMFPISVLQNSVKLTNEPPKGIKANLIRALADMNKDYFEKHALGKDWRALVFGLCVFHSVILERRKFGPLGWNILYEFNENDRECGLRILDMFMDKEIITDIPWDALTYINGEITWGGRVTDYWDQRCLRTVLKMFSSPRILDESYTYGRNPVYRNPNRKTLQEYQEYVSNLPIEDDPDIFGMHKNANIVFQTAEAEFLIGTLLLGQPRAATGSAQSHDNEIVIDAISRVSQALARKILTDNMFPELQKLDAKGRVPSLTTVLVQEIDRYNILLKVVHDSLGNLSKAIKGLVVMSEVLEGVFHALLNNLVPGLWSKKSFLSIKTLPNWVADFQRRIDFIQHWQQKGPPMSFWLSGFYFPQSFLTGILQTHARRFDLPIDALKIDFEVWPNNIIQQDIYDYHKNNKETTSLFGNMTRPDIGVFIHGLFIEAARWNKAAKRLQDAEIGELFSRVPVIWFKPCLELDSKGRYEAPLYKTQVRAGVLSTTGHSTNFVLPILLECTYDPDFWILRGTALITAVADNIS